MAENELSPAEKIQAEYNHLCAQHGHLTAQIMALKKDRLSVRDKFQKLMNRASNLPKEEIQKVKEPSNEPAAEIATAAN